MAKQVRMVTAAADVAPIIDRGSEVDTELKNLTYEDKGIKARLGEIVGNDLQAGETGLRLAGNKAAALVSVVEKYELDSSKETFPAVQRAVAAGKLAGVVEKKQELAVPPADIEKAAAILKQAGINALIAESFSVVAEGYRTVKSTDAAVQAALESCVSKSVSFRVKYEKV